MYENFLTNILQVVSMLRKTVLSYRQELNETSLYTSYISLDVRRLYYSRQRSSFIIKINTKII